jgi:hypothetical protein
MHGESILEGIDGHGMHGEFMSGTKDSNWDFTSVGDEDFVSIGQDLRLLTEFMKG